MNTEGNFYGQIEAYLTNRLSAAERTAFEKALAADPALARETELRRLEFEVSEALIADTIREHMKKLQVETPVPWKKYRLYWLLAALTLLTTLALIYRAWPAADPAEAAPPAEIKSAPKPAPMPDTPPPQATHTPPGAAPAKPTAPANRQLALATELYRPPEFEALRSAEPAPDDPVEVGLSAWKNQDFNAVVALLQPIATDHPAYWRALTLRAHAHFRLKQYRQASRDFTAIAAGKVMPWSEEAEGYLLLALLADGQGDAPAFQLQLQKILADAGHPAFDLAQAIQVRRAKQ